MRLEFNDGKLVTVYVATPVILGFLSIATMVVTVIF